MSPMTRSWLLHVLLRFGLGSQTSLIRECCDKANPHLNFANKPGKEIIGKDSLKPGSGRAIRALTIRTGVQAGAPALPVFRFRVSKRTAFSFFASARVRLCWLLQ